MNIAIDVGANQGDFSLDLARRNPNLLVIAIEPIPELCIAIKRRAELESLGNIVVIECAIDSTERIAQFNISNHKRFI